MFEKVNPGHPDKMADRLAGAVVDLVYERAGGLTKANPRVACEVMDFLDFEPRKGFKCAEYFE